MLQHHQACWSCICLLLIYLTIICQLLYHEQRVTLLGFLYLTLGRTKATSSLTKLDQRPIILFRAMKNRNNISRYIPQVLMNALLAARKMAAEAPSGTEEPKKLCKLGYNKGRSHQQLLWH